MAGRGFLLWPLSPPAIGQASVRQGPCQAGRGVWPPGGLAPVLRVWGMHSASHRRVPERPSPGACVHTPITSLLPRRPCRPRCSGHGPRGPWARERSPQEPVAIVTVCGGRDQEPGPVFGSKVRRSRPLSFASCSAQSPLCKRGSGVRPACGPVGLGLRASAGPSHRDTQGVLPRARLDADEGAVLSAVVHAGRWAELTVMGAVWPPGQGTWRVSSGVALG